MSVVIDWNASAGSVCTCCKKVISPHRPSLAAKAAADAATLADLRILYKKAKNDITNGYNKLVQIIEEFEKTKTEILTVRKQLEFYQDRAFSLGSSNSALRESNSELQKRIAELEKLLESQLQTNTPRREIRTLVACKKLDSLDGEFASC